MVAKEVMYLQRILAFKCSTQIHELVGFVAAAVRVLEGAMDQLLQHQVAARIRSKSGAVKDLAEVVYVAVQVASDQDFNGSHHVRNVTHPAGRGPEQLDGLSKSAQKSVGVGHRHSC